MSRTIDDIRDEIVEEIDDARATLDDAVRALLRAQGLARKHGEWQTLEDDLIDLANEAEAVGNEVADLQVPVPDPEWDRMRNLYWEAASLTPEGGLT